MAVKQFGPAGGPLWTNMNVYLPGKGVTVRSDCLYFPIATNIYENANGETIYQAYPTVLTLPNAARAGSYTIVARIYPEQLVGGPSGHDAYFYNNALNWGSWAGAEFGISRGTDKTGNTFYPRALLAHTWYAATSLTMRTNTWYDIAFSVTDNGYDAEGNALTDSLLIAVYDKEHGLRFYAQNISTNASTFYGSWAGCSQLSEQNQYTSLEDFWNATTSKEINSGNPAKSFRGMIHQLAIWDRALTIDEIASAFSHPNNMVLGVGTADGASGEFATSGGSMPAELATNHTFTFVTRQYNRSASGPYDFRILLNGVPKYRTPEGGIAKGEDAVFEVDKGGLAAGWNTIGAEYLSTNGWITFDFFRLAISDYFPSTFLIIR